MILLGHIDGVAIAQSVRGGVRQGEGVVAELSELIVYCV